VEKHKHPNICIKGIPEVENKEKSTEKNYNNG
jgi:hypothetical protein